MDKTVPLALKNEWSNEGSSPMQTPNQEGHRRGTGAGSQGCRGSRTLQSCRLTLMLKAARASARTLTGQAFLQRAAEHGASEGGDL